MSTRRILALNDVINRKPISIKKADKKVSEYYGSDVFGLDAMREFLSEEAFNSIQNSMHQGTIVERKMADQVAACMKAWAQSKGVTHFTHWFQPLSGATAEKHDGFFEPIEGGRAIERFSGNALVQQEPDASSFPNGGIRNTFEARGYTAWDPTSPAFIWGETLCIPTIFISYTGESLDFKTPLLKALHCIDKAATDVCQYFDKNVTKVIATLGWEQEYFLIDSALYNIRYDLQQTGRTLFGHASAKGQQLEDHYWGSIPERVSAFMRDFEYESHLLGIPVRTRHNEVAPAQFECAPVFEETNLAVDHNLLLMDVMEKVAIRHNFRVLLHEKPYAGVNGSGKHNNWSLATNSGKNLLSPGKTPKTNLQFLTFFVNTVMAVYEHADLLRASIASANSFSSLGSRLEHQRSFVIISSSASGRKRTARIIPGPTGYELHPRRWLPLGFEDGPSTSDPAPHPTPYPWEAIRCGPPRQGFPRGPSPGPDALAGEAVAARRWVWQPWLWLET